MTNTPTTTAPTPICADAGRLQCVEQVVGKTCLLYLLEAQSEGSKP